MLLSSLIFGDRKAKEHCSNIKFNPVLYKGGPKVPKGFFSQSSMTEYSFNCCTQKISYDLELRFQSFLSKFELVKLNKISSVI